MFGFFFLPHYSETDGRITYAYETHSATGKLGFTLLP